MEKGRKPLGLGADLPKPMHMPASPHLLDRRQRPYPLPGADHTSTQLTRPSVASTACYCPRNLAPGTHAPLHLSIRTPRARDKANYYTMPTPESEMFKASKPTVPPTFDGVDYDDNKALKAAQDSVIREQWVQSMMARLVREELGKCYYREGVNHLEKCGHLRGKQKPQTQRQL